MTVRRLRLFSLAVGSIVPPFFVACGSFAGNGTPDVADAAPPVADGPSGADADADAASADGGVDVVVACASDCTPGACVEGQCQPYPVTKAPDAGAIVGLGVRDTSIFFTVPTEKRIYSAATTPGSTAVPRLENQVGVGSIEVVGVNEIRWARNDGSNGGIWSANHTGGALNRVAFPGFACGSFTTLALPTFHFCSNGQNIGREDDAPTLDAELFVSGSAVKFMDGSGASIYWTDQTSIRKGPKTGGAAPPTAGAIILDKVSAVGIAIRGSWVYFNRTDGSVARVPTDASAGATELVAPDPAASAPLSMSDIAVTADGRAYWAKNDSVYGLVLPPE